MNEYNMVDSSMIGITIWIILFYCIIFLAIFWLKAYGLWKLNKKLWEPMAWLAFIPLIQFVLIVKTSWKSMLWILWIILWYIAFIIPWLILHIIMYNWISKRIWRSWWTTAMLFLYPLLAFPMVWTEYNGWQKKDNTISSNPIEL